MSTNNTLKKQLGLTTLIFSSIILFAICLLVLYASKSALIEQKIHRNLNEINQKLLSAQASLNQHINEFQQKSSSEIDIDALTYLTQTKSNKENQQAYKIVSNVDNDLEDISVWFSQLPIIGLNTEHLPVFPLIVKQSLMVNYQFQIINQQYQRTIWAGDQVDLGQLDNTLTQTMINNQLISTSNPANGNHIDIADKDRSLALLSEDEFFYKMINESPQWIKQWLKDQAAYYPTSELDKIDGAKNMIWIGNGNQEVILSSINLGSTSKPVFVFVDAKNASLMTQGEININGLLYIRGDWQPHGTLNVNGMMIVEGKVFPSLSPEFTQTHIVYQPENLKLTSGSFTSNAMINGSYHYLGTAN